MPSEEFKLLSIASASNIRHMVTAAKLNYVGPEYLEGTQTIVKSDDGMIRITATETPAVFYALTANGVTISTGTGEDMLELLLTIFKHMLDGMMELSKA